MEKEIHVIVVNPSLTVTGTKPVGLDESAFVSSVVGWGGVNRDGKPLACTPVAREWFFKKHMKIAIHVLQELAKVTKPKRRGRKRKDAV